MSSCKFIIDTNKYAGEFERQMCAYITAQYGECGVGMAIADSERPHIRNIGWFDNHVEQIEEDRCSRPVVIYPTPGWFNNGTGKHYLDNGENEKIAREENIRSVIEYHTALQNLSKSN